MALPDKLLAAARRLCADLAPLRFARPVTHVYNPLVHARRAHAQYLRRYATGPKRVVLLGMNPGPYGMVQTGVPFGEVALVRDWLGIEARVDAPATPHPKRPVEGFACTRSEVSGARLWGAIRNRYGSPEAFFRQAFIANYCPLVFMEAGGRNRTPDKLAPAERKRLYAACDDHLRRVITLLEPEWVVGVGRFAEGRARDVLEGTGVRIGSLLHPSPASPRANQGWEAAATAELTAQGICKGR